MSLKVFLPLQFFLNNLRKIGINYSVNVGYNSPVKAIWSWTFVYWEFFSFSLLMIQFHH